MDKVLGKKLSIEQLANKVDVVEKGLSPKAKKKAYEAAGKAIHASKEVDNQLTKHNTILANAKSSAILEQAVGHHMLGKPLCVYQVYDQLLNASCLKRNVSASQQREELYMAATCGRLQPAKGFVVSLNSVLDAMMQCLETKERVERLKLEHLFVEMSKCLS